MCPWLQRAQTWASCAYAHRYQSSSQLPVARQFWQPRKWKLPSGIAPGSRLDHALPCRIPASIGAYPAPARRTIWHRSRALRSGWLRLCDAWQRVHRARSSTRSGTAGTCPPINFSSGLQSQMVRSLYDCPGVPVGSVGMSCRVVVATHPESSKKSPVGVTRAGIVYELFFTNLPQQAFTASDVVGLYLHRGAFEPALADEDTEQDPDRWCSHSAWGQECWQVVSQWVPEPAPGTGASVGADAHTHHRVCSCASTSFTAHGSPLGLCSPSRGLTLESWSLLRSGLCSPGRWDSALPR
jgi:hypothetical protein